MLASQIQAYLAMTQIKTHILALRPMSKSRHLLCLTLLPAKRNLDDIQR